MGTEITKENLPIIVALCAAIVIIIVLFVVWFIKFRRTAVSTKPVEAPRCEHQETNKQARAGVEQQLSHKMKSHEAESRRLEAAAPTPTIDTVEQGGVNPSACAAQQTPNPSSFSRSETIAEDELTPTVVRHPHVTRHLQKTDSRIAMYGGEPFYDIDLNPSLKSVDVTQ
uniref:Secreted protein n=1 Tax=Steinernema glaseri TaxID=37863 RepID=A0A1I7Z6F1_9BILA